MVSAPAPTPPPLSLLQDKIERKTESSTFHIIQSRLPPLPLSSCIYQQNTIEGTEGHPFKIRSKKPDLYLNTSDSISINEFASHPDLPLLLSLYPKLQDKEP